MAGGRNSLAWMILSGMLALGMASLAVLVWALGSLLSGASYYLFLPIAFTAVMAFVFVALLAMGIVYRIDRVSGRVNRRVRMFE